MLKLRFEILELRNGVTKPGYAPIFPYVYNHADFGNPFINRRAFIYLAISKLSFTFKYLQEFKVAYQQRQLERLIFDYTLLTVGS